MTSTDARPTAARGVQPAGDESIGARSEPDTDTETGTDADSDSEPGDSAESVVVDSVTRPTNRWTGVGAVALLFGAAGVIVTAPALLLASVVGIAYAAYARIGQAPEPVLSITRNLEDEDCEPGEKVRVTVRVRNDGDEILPDLRLVDGVPAELVVTEDVPRYGTALRPGETETFSYSVTVRQGTHAFEPVSVVARGYTGAVERVQQVRVDSELHCPPATAETDLPLRSLTMPLTGRVETDVGGEGLEFHATREYRRGDPLSRIDWNRLARGDDLTTVTFREERSATVTLVIETREAAYRRPDETGRHAVDRSIEAAINVLDALVAGGNSVGLASFGPRQCWLPPGSGTDHRATARRRLTTDPAFALTPPESSMSMFHVRLRQFRSRLPSDSQVLLFTPLCDDEIIRVAQLLEADGHLVTVISPDPTGRETPGERLAAVERTIRISTLRGAGIGVVDWSTDESLAASLAAAQRRWSA